MMTGAALVHLLSEVAHGRVRATSAAVPPFNIDGSKMIVPCSIIFAPWAEWNDFVCFNESNISNMCVQHVAPLEAEVSLVTRHFC